MNQTRLSLSAKDQLINQIIHQGKAKRSTLATDTYSRSLSVKGYSFGPCRGRGTNNSTNSKGRAFRSGAPVKGSKPHLAQKNQRIQYPRGQSNRPALPRNFGIANAAVSVTAIHS
jgi:hypothetical protein